MAMEFRVGFRAGLLRVEWQVFYCSVDDDRIHLQKVPTKTTSRPGDRLHTLTGSKG